MRHTGKLRGGFSLVELLLVLGILAMLAVLAYPAVQGMRARAETVACQGNLRQLWMGVNAATTDNGNKYPSIKFSPEDAGAAAGAKDLAGTLSPYGISLEALQCPSDIRGPGWFSKMGTSYLWEPMVEDEAFGNVRLVTPWRTVAAARGSRVRLLTDFEAVHQTAEGGRRRMNVIYVDGHVVAR